MTDKTILGYINTLLFTAARNVDLNDSRAKENVISTIKNLSMTEGGLTELGKAIQQLAMMAKEKRIEVQIEASKTIENLAIMFDLYLEASTDEPVEKSKIAQFIAEIENDIMTPLTSQEGVSKKLFNTLKQITGDKNMPRLDKIITTAIKTLFANEEGVTQLKNGIKALTDVAVQSDQDCKDKTISILNQLSKNLNSRMTLILEQEQSSTVEANRLLDCSSHIISSVSSIQKTLVSLTQRDSFHGTSGIFSTSSTNDETAYLTPQVR